MSPRQEMTYIKSRKEWRRMFHGTLYRVSSRKLGVRPGKEEGREAANAFWDAIEAEYYKEQSNHLHWAKVAIEAASKLIQPEHIPTDVMGWLDRCPEYSESYKKAIAFQLFGRERAASLYNGDTQVILDQKTTSADKTVKHHVAGYLKMQESRCKNGTIKPNSFAKYGYNLAPFAEWFGNDKDVSTIDETTVENYYDHLTNADLCNYEKKGRFRLFKSFVQYLYEKELVELPRNIKKAEYGFGHQEREIDFWTADEFQMELQKADDFGLLCLLLAANCGFYGSDMGLLKWSGEDYIYRYRTKTGEDGTKITFFLWPETKAALEKSYHLLKGGWSAELVNGKVKRVDKFGKLSKKLVKPLSDVRNSSCQFLEQNKDYRQYKDYFLAHAAEKLSDINYSRPVTPQEMFSYLRERYFGK